MSTRPASRPASPPEVGPDPVPAELVAREAGEVRRVFRRDGASGRRGWRVAGAAAETLPAGAYLLRRDFPYLCIEYVASGRGSVELGGAARALAAGRFYATAPDTRLGLRVDAQRPLRRYTLWLDGPGADAALEGAGLAAGRVRATATPGEIRETWEWLLRDGARPGPRGAALARALADVLLLKLGEARDGLATEAVEGSRETFERCRALADMEAERLRGAAELATAARLRTETLCRLFRRYLDTTPGAYLRARRMRIAAERLTRPDARVKEVAAALGFADAFHFSRVFKTEIGVSPRAWRARAAAGADDGDGT